MRVGWNSGSTDSRQSTNGGLARVITILTQTAMNDESVYRKLWSLAVQSSLGLIFGIEILSATFVPRNAKTPAYACTTRDSMRWSAPSAT